MSQKDDLLAAVAAVRASTSAEIARVEALINTPPPPDDPQIAQAIVDLNSIKAELDAERP
jgi:hypothetical protein